MVQFHIFICLIIIYYHSSEKKIPNCAVPKNIQTNHPQKRLEFPWGREVLYDQKNYRNV